MSRSPRLSQIEDMLAADPTDVLLRYMLGMEYASAGDDEAAIREFSKLSDGTAPYIPAFHMGGQALIRIGREAEAAVLLGKGIALARDTGDFHAAGEMEGLLMSIQ